MLQVRCDFGCQAQWDRTGASRVAKSNQPVIKVKKERKSEQHCLLNNLSISESLCQIT